VTCRYSGITIEKPPAVYYLEVAVNRPLQQTFCYTAESIPEKPVGCRLSVPFGSTTINGIVVSVSDTPPPQLDRRIKLKKIDRFIEDLPVINTEGIKLAGWVSRYYFCSLGQALATVIPAGIRSVALPDDIYPQKSEELHPLTQEQDQALHTLKKAIDNNAGETLLLHGSTGSGKTEVYRHAALYAQKQQMSILILVPEIALTPQTVSRFSGIFHSRIALLHSRLTPAQRITRWRQLLSGEIRVAIGARSAVFAPLSDPLFIILDEEHEQSYKAGDCPRYHARQVAFYRTRKKGCLLLGSATPNIETWYHARQGTISYLSMQKRISPHPGPELQLIDLSSAPAGAVLSPALIEAIKTRHEAGEQTILFMNRRGYATFIYCKDCDEPATCPHCSISLNLHKDKGVLLCHHCGHAVLFQQQCPTCGGKKIRTSGTGTQKVEHFLEKRVPGIRFQRMDSDSVNNREKLFEILSRFRKGEIDVLIGTRMVGKGLDFPNVTLVGVVFADSEMNMPDFRSFERTFTQLTQVLGRCGRADKAGKGFIQTLQPEADALQSVLAADLEGFYSREIKRREDGRYPPFSRLIRLVIRSKKDAAAREAAAVYKKLLEQRKPDGARLLGPAPCPLARISRNFRHQLLLSAPEISDLLKWVRGAGLHEGTRKNIYIEIDVDPLSML